MSEAAVRRLRELEKDNVRLKRLLAERDLEVDVLKEFLQKSSHRRGTSPGREVSAPAEVVPATGM